MKSEKNEIQLKNYQKSKNQIKLKNEIKWIKMKCDTHFIFSQKMKKNELAWKIK